MSVTDLLESTQTGVLSAGYAGVVLMIDGLDKLDNWSRSLANIMLPVSRSELWAIVVNTYIWWPAPFQLGKVR